MIIRSSILYLYGLIAPLLSSPSRSRCSAPSPIGLIASLLSLLVELFHLFARRVSGLRPSPFGLTVSLHFILSHSWTLLPLSLTISLLRFILSHSFTLLPLSLTVSLLRPTGLTVSLPHLVNSVSFPNCIACPSPFGLALWSSSFTPRKLGFMSSTLWLSE